jgi:hypothetical protein
MFAYATVQHHRLGAYFAPKPAGRTWQCLVLPSFWGENAWTLAGVAHHKGSPLPSDFAGASGPAAGAGFCQLGRLSFAKKGTTFFSWAPNTSSCQAYYKLKEVPDPNNAGQTTNPEFPARMWDDYQQLPCP